MQMRATTPRIKLNILRVRTKSHAFMLFCLKGESLLLASGSAATWRRARTWSISTALRRSSESAVRGRSNQSVYWEEGFQSFKIEKVFKGMTHKHDRRTGS